MREPTPGCFFSRLIIDPSGCVLWTGPQTWDGYGRFYVNRRTLLVHRAMWEMFCCPIPPGLVCDHLCRVRHCANVAHLEVVTRRENTLRGTSLQAINARKVECDNGHPFDEANTYRGNTKSNGAFRQCRACNRAAARRYRQLIRSTP